MDMVSTAEVAAGERFAFWRAVNAKLWVPYELRCAPQTVFEICRVPGREGSLSLA
ncbi:hypothetical protein ACQEV9_45650 [Streptomyces chartreusis]|uniref:hypothetical protein n=1 Tax=Streptomyces chartreusis TaxID=1969 RepID=UPI003D8A7A22